MAGSAVAAMILLFVSGCGGASVGDVSGTVKFKGALIPNGPHYVLQAKSAARKAQGGRIQNGGIHGRTH